MRSPKDLKREFLARQELARAVLAHFEGLNSVAGKILFALTDHALSKQKARLLTVHGEELKEETTIELIDLVGEHILDAVDFVFENEIRFRLDGLVYRPTNEPSAEYSDSISKLVVCNELMINVFQGVRVIGRYFDSDDDRGSVDILKLFDADTGKTVLEVGTRFPGYCPVYVAGFYPENMSINK